MSVGGGAVRLALEEVQCDEHHRRAKPHAVQHMSSSCGVWVVEGGAGRGDVWTSKKMGEKTSTELGCGLVSGHLQVSRLGLEIAAKDWVAFLRVIINI
jgi:hypothetical protein